MISAGGAVDPCGICPFLLSTDASFWPRFVSCGYLDARLLFCFQEPMLMSCADTHAHDHAHVLRPLQDGGDGGGGQLDDAPKRIRALQKKLRQIETIKEKRAKQGAISMS